ncbi:MAG: hypothetical protein ACYCO3_08410 [Mycobacteriales bacterium]
MSRPSYAAVCRRIGDWWAIEVPQVRGVHTQTRRLDQVEGMTREAIALLLDVPADSFDVSVEPLLDPDVQATVSAATEASEKARGAAKDAGRLQREAARTLLAKYRLTVRDAGTLLRLSPQRVSQLAARPRIHTAPSPSKAGSDKNRSSA